MQRIMPFKHQTAGIYQALWKKQLNYLQLCSLGPLLEFQESQLSFFFFFNQAVFLAHMVVEINQKKNC